ncbi:receptor-like protein 33 [Cornus florida]|uniref:receptor-like protein 33 n=1 Tax=Cornus florida TaxID=4283 RepID=UPI002896E532|nr:receptor-like protein 33 [Cornus florida]
MAVFQKHYIFLFLILVFFSLLSTIISSRRTEAEALLKWKNSLLSSNNFITSWFVTDIKNHCNWTGIVCHSVEIVSEINLFDSNLNGTLTQFNFISFPNLTHFNLSRNQLNGPIPFTIGNLSMLVVLDLSSNNFKGIIPLEIGFLTELGYLSFLSNNLNGIPMLTHLYFDSNQLISEFPDFILHCPNLTLPYFLYNHFTGLIPELVFTNLTKLEYLNLTSNSFQGLLSANISKFLKLKDLGLGNNQFVSSIPEEIRLVSDLQIISLSNNTFHGKILSSIGQLRKLLGLDLQINDLNSSVPSQLGLCTELTLLSLSMNLLTGPLHLSLSNLSKISLFSISDNFLSCKILPYLVTNWTELEFLNLQNNSFTCKIPPEIGLLTNLTFLDLSVNSLIGPLPLSLSNLSKIFSLYISDNFPSGEISPYFVTNWTNLETLQLQKNSFIGKIPPEIGVLHKLWYLDISANQLSGPIPLTIGNLTSLSSLNLFDNYLNGTIAPEIRNLKLLDAFDMSKNKLNGEIPAQVGHLTQLSYLNLESNEFMGEIPPTIYNLSSLHVLNLFNNRLVNVIPQCLGNFSHELSVLDLRMNHFHGTIAAIFTKCNNLRNLDLSGNHLEGPVPQSLVNYRQLEVIDLANNNIIDTFPHWMDDLLELQVLVLRSNRFGGAIDTSTSKLPFPKLRIIDLSHNEFAGPLPTKYFKNVKAMMNVDEHKVGREYIGEKYNYYRDLVKVVVKGLELELSRILTIFIPIDLSSNNFHGEITDFIGMFHSLRLLNLSHNSITGHISSSLKNLTRLESLDLSSNQLVREIPWQLTSLTILLILNFSQNHLVGPIPHGQQFDKFENNSYSGNQALFDFPLTKKCFLACPSGSIRIGTNFFQAKHSGTLGGTTGEKIFLMAYLSFEHEEYYRRVAEERKKYFRAISQVCHDVFTNNWHHFGFCHGTAQAGQSAIPVDMPSTFVEGSPSQQPVHSMPQVQTVQVPPAQHGKSFQDLAQSFREHDKYFQDLVDILKEQAIELFNQSSRATLEVQLVHNALQIPLAVKLIPPVVKSIPPPLLLQVQVLTKVHKLPPAVAQPLGVASKGQVKMC